MSDVDTLVAGRGEPTRIWRVLMAHECGGGGSGQQVLDLSDGLIKRGHRVSLVYSRRRAEAWYVERAAHLGFEQLVEIDMRRAPGWHDPGVLRRLQAFLASTGPYDVVHGHSSKAGALARLATPATWARVYTPHAFRTMDPMAGALSGAAYGLIESVLGWAATDALIAVSPEEAEHARSLGIAASKIHLAPNGVDPFLSESRVEVRAELGLQEDHIAVGFVGRLTWQKDPLRFCHAIAHAQQRDSRIIGVMVGDGDLAEAVRATGGPVLFLGWREARAVMSAFDVLAVTSRYEGMPYVFLEALQAGLPIVSTEVGGSRLAIRPGENGFVAPRDATPAVFGEALLALGDDALRARMAEASQRLAPNFTTERMISATERVYEQALSGKPALVRPQTVQTAKGYARA